MYEVKGNKNVISGEISIPVLGCQASLDLIVNDEGAEFSSSIDLFDGNIASNEVTAKWDWALTKFEGSIDNFVIGPFKVDNVLFAAGVMENIVNFSAQASIPILGCSASVVIHSTQESAEFNAHLNLFRGLINVNSLSRWNWDGSHYLLSFTNTQILFLNIQEAKIEFTETSAEAMLDATIFGVILQVEGRFDQNGIHLNSSIGNGVFQLSGDILFGGPKLSNYRFDSSEFLEPLEPLARSPRQDQVNNLIHAC